MPDVVVLVDELNMLPVLDFGGTEEVRARVEVPEILGHAAQSEPAGESPVWGDARVPGSEAPDSGREAWVEAGWSD